MKDKKETKREGGGTRGRNVGDKKGWERIRREGRGEGRARRQGKESLKEG